MLFLVIESLVVLSRLLILKIPLKGDIWELRPLDNRIMYAYWKDNTFVLLHYFNKKTKKTPKSEIQIAKNNLKDFLERNG